MGLALLFPGQGSQFVGMGRELAQAFPEARTVFEQADEVLDFRLSRLMWEGPEAELTETRNAQPALMVHSMAVHRALGEAVTGARYAAGHSLGELSAHVAAGTMSLADGLRAVRRRGELMFEAGQARPGTMAAVLGLDDDAVEEVCAGVTQGVCVPANFNAPGQVVLSGDAAGVEEGLVRAREAGAKRVLPLKVSGAFHSPLMEPAEDGFSAHLEAVRLHDPGLEVFANVTARPVLTGELARDLLVRQLTAPVRWSASVAAMVADGADRFLELGPGSVLSNLNKRNAKGLPCASVGTPEEVEAVMEGMNV
ncbi:MAG: ACP S-malonyltransferase [Gemmatimonadota bacterium]